MTQQKPPAHLSPASAQWWMDTVTGFDLQPHHIHLLTLAAECLDKSAEASAYLKKHGNTYKDSRGNPKARPECHIERAAKITFSRLLRELDLDHNAPDTPRPPALRSNRVR